MTRTLLLILIAAAGPLLSAQAQNVVPADMERLRTAYEAARERANRPIDEKYLAELIKLQDTYTKAGKLEEAVAVSKEVTGMKERMGLMVKSRSSTQAAPAAATKPAAAKGGQETTITISANSPNGYRIGAVKRGDMIILEYTGGMWKSKGSIATESPDDPKATYGEDDRLVIAEAGDDSGLPGKTIVVVPPETAKKPFSYLVQTSRNDVVLRINSNSQRKENPGAVTYKLKLVR